MLVQADDINRRYGIQTLGQAARASAGTAGNGQYVPALQSSLELQIRVSISQQASFDIARTLHKQAASVPVSSIQMTNSLQEEAHI